MNHRALLLFVAFMLVEGSSTAQEPSAISEEANDDPYDRVCDRIKRQRQPQEVASLDHRFKAVYRQTHPGVYGRNADRVTILDKNGRKLASHVLADYAGRLVAAAHWSPDSKFCVFTTISAGGHSPWVFQPYVFSVATRRFRFLGDGSFAPVTDPEFRFTAPATALFTTNQGITPLRLASPSQRKSEDMIASLVWAPTASERKRAEKIARKYAIRTLGLSQGDVAKMKTDITGFLPHRGTPRELLIQFYDPAVFQPRPSGGFEMMRGGFPHYFNIKVNAETWKVSDHYADRM